VKILDLADNPRVERYTQMVCEISLARSPRDVLMAFSRHYWQLRPSDYMISMSTRGLPDGHYRVTRQIDMAALRAQASSLEALDPWGDRPPAPPRTGGFLGELIRRQRPLIVHDMNVRNDPVLGDALAQMGSAVVLPLYDQGHPVYWNLAFRKEPDYFAAEHLESSILIANLTAGTNTRLLLMDEVRTLNAALRREFDEVARIQRALLPRQVPAIKGLSIATSYLTSEQAGGDYYDFFPFQNGAWGLLIADVSGHGAAAATVMAMLRGILHAYRGPAAPDAVLRYANAQLLEAAIESTFVTAFLAVYEPGAATITYARAGHNPPRVKRGRDGTVTSLCTCKADGKDPPESADGPPLGLFDPYEISSHMLALRPMDTLVLYTDGISESMNAAGDLFGPDRLDHALATSSSEPARLIEAVHAALVHHTGHRPRRDDQTMVVVRYEGTDCARPPCG
jgi:sigma-B regulation protein RsbU (phosphoserine phosphatase)